MKTRLACGIGPIAIAFLFGALCLGGCDDGGGSYGLDDGTGPEDGTVSLCDSYPTPTNAFSLGAVPRNYEFWDMNDDEHQLCEFVTGNAKLMLLAITDET